MKLNRRGFMKALAALGLTGLPEAPAEEAAEELSLDQQEIPIETPSPRGLGKFDTIAMIESARAARPFVHIKRNVHPRLVQPLGSELLIDVGYAIQTRVISGYTEWFDNGIAGYRNNFLHATMRDLRDEGRVLALARRDIDYGEWDTPIPLAMWFAEAELAGDSLACGDVVWLEPIQRTMTLGPNHVSVELERDAVAKMVRDAVAKELRNA